jgi:hypothetical protein
VGVAIGTTTNLKFVQPAVNLRAAMAHQYQEPIHVGTPVVVDSSGIGGIFWTVQDGMDAASNAAVPLVRPVKGTYGHILMGNKHAGLRLSCSSPRHPLNLDGGVLIQSTTTNALAFNGYPYGLIVENCGFQTYSGGGSDNQAAVSVGYSVNWTFQNNVIVGSDNSGFILGGTDVIIANNTFFAADYWGIYVNHHYGDRNLIVGNYFYAGHAFGSIGLIANTNYNAVVGNVMDTAPSNLGTGNEIVGNTTY